MPFMPPYYSIDDYTGCPCSARADAFTIAIVGLQKLARSEVSSPSGCSESMQAIAKDFLMIIQSCRYKAKRKSSNPTKSCCPWISGHKGPPCARFFLTL